MSQLLQPLTFPLHGSRLIEASAGTGKTWTIAALYLRLVLGHGGEDGGDGGGFARPLLPPEILVMTFTRAATRELSNRVRERLVQAARHFRGEDVDADPYLDELAAAYDGDARALAAHRLMMAAETMDEAAVFTIDAWCQRMLREHAFDSGSLFDEELVSDERTLLEDATHDYWRQHVYPLAEPELDALLACLKDVGKLCKDVRPLVARAERLGTDGEEPLGVLVARMQARRRDELARRKADWAGRIDALEQWIADQRAAAPKGFDGRKMVARTLAGWFGKLRDWVADPALETPQLTDKAWERLCRAGILEACNPGFEPAIPAEFDALKELQTLADPARPALLRHAAARIARRVAELKRRNRQFGFADMLARLKAALEGPNGEALRRRIVDQYPVALIDEFQDTSPAQYRIFDLLYRVADNDPARGLFLIGDPKQSIYGFRGADIHSYLSARRATAGRHYQLGTNFRSAARLVAAVNRMFQHAEGDGTRAGHAAGAFRFRKDGANPLPFEPVDAAGRKETLVGVDGPLQALAVNAAAIAFSSKSAYTAFFAEHCAEHIVRLLDDEHAGLRAPDGTFTRLKLADIAVLVRDRGEAAAIRRALDRRGVRSVYLSDKDSVLASPEAADVLRWLKAVASPLDGTLARAAFASATCNLPLAELVRLAGDEQAWERRVEQLKALHVAWQRQGVLAMLRRFIHELELPARLLRPDVPGGERSLTNLLHLAELLQEASRELDGEQALIRWFGEQLQDDGEDDELVLRLESDAELVKVVTVHKSKGLEYPLVYLPFAASARKATATNRSFLDYVDADGERRLDLQLDAAALAAADRERLDEEVRLLYVALTRARHFLWLGVAARAGKNGSLHESALGWLLAGGAEIAPEALGAHWEALRGDADGIEVLPLAEPDGVTVLRRAEALPQLEDAAPYAASFERNWAVGSFTSLTRHTVAAPTRAQEENLMEEAEPGTVAPARAEDAPWHRFPRGSTPGNFLHEQLEWMAHEGFALADDEDFRARLAQRIARAGWGNREADALAWLRTVATTRLPPLGAALADLAAPVPEMEFWFPSHRLQPGALDALCRRHLLGSTPRPALSGRELHGMLKGFMDLVFEHEGRYWVLDYKSNALGPGDASYTRAAMAAGMAAHRYDIQGALYLLALHRLLRARLGAGYDPARQLGGAVFLFLRGIANPATHGCHLIEPDPALLDGLDRLLGDGRDHDD
ncbi:exodeoxyribonuclease V subunit beta [uncultured Massilia sp.]|uniref:exodeoxyribonuclease V subunit beta n=1 Tax=uncultured Massilia sp. TaxID=169973 RepID=UPI0025CD6FD9|nr:exodeoxyribonuclease V subunit beta [uncultured Massilia sp.]